MNWGVGSLMLRCVGVRKPGRARVFDKFSSRTLEAGRRPQASTRGMC